MLFFRKKNDENIISIIYKQGRIKRAIFFILGIFIVAAAFNVFMLPNDVVYGVSGLAIILNKTFGFDVPLTILIGSLFLLILSLIFMGKEKTSKTILGSLLYPIFVKCTEWVVPFINLSDVEPLLTVGFGAIISGFGFGLIFKSGYTTGGTDILNQIVSKYFKMSMGNAMFFTDGLIIVIGLFVFGLPKFLYSIVNICLISYMTDKVILGISQSKTFFIITNHETSVKKFIMDNLSNGVTIIDSRGGFTGDFKKMIMCTIPTKDYFILKEGLFKIDPDIFFIATDAYEVSEHIKK